MSSQEHLKLFCRHGMRCCADTPEDAGCNLDAMTTRISANPFTRRAVLISAASAALAPGAFLRAEQRKPLLARLGEVEEKSGGRLGCAVLDTASGHRFAYRGTDRFPMCSTFKLLAVALVLRRVDRGEEQLERRIVYSREDVLSYAPVTSLHVQDGMTVEELCAAAITLSDNTAANLLLKSFGGPAGLNDFLRGIGDSITRLDRTEPTLNEAAPGDDRDTTTPSMMLEDMRRLLLGDVLKPDARGRLTHWLVDCKTGDTRLRGGLPPEWKAGDKTGSGDHGTTNDIAIIWPPNHAPVLVTAYLTGSPLSSDDRSAVLKQVGQAVARELGHASPGTR